MDITMPEKAKFTMYMFLGPRLPEQAKKLVKAQKDNKTI